MDATDVIQKLFEDVVPERIEEINVLVNRYSAQFRLIADREGFILEGGSFSAIQFTGRSARQMWLFGHAGRQALHCYASIIMLLRLTQATININEFDCIPGQAAKDKAFSEILDKVKELNGVFHEDDFTWPRQILKPERGRPKAPEGAAVFDLTCMATAYVFLHELKHVIFSVEGDAPEDPIEEEYRCDQFAKEMMISKVNKYCRVSGYPKNKVTMKRMMGIALASAFLLFATGKDRLAGSDTHPSVHGRWLSTVKDICLGDNDSFWLYFSSFSLALLKYYSIKVAPKLILSYKQFCLELIQDLENGI